MTQKDAAKINQYQGMLFDLKQIAGNLSFSLTTIQNGIRKHAKTFDKFQHSDQSAHVQAELEHYVANKSMELSALLRHVGQGISNCRLFDILFIFG